MSVHFSLHWKMFDLSFVHAPMWASCTLRLKIKEKNVQIQVGIKGIRRNISKVFIKMNLQASGLGQITFGFISFRIRAAQIVILRWFHYATISFFIASGKFFASWQPLFTPFHRHRLNWLLWRSTKFIHKSYSTNNKSHNCQFIFFLMACLKHTRNSTA